MIHLLIMLAIGWLLLRWLWPREELRQLCAPRPTILVVLKNPTITIIIQKEK
jgi:hypothetical protein